MKSLISDEAGSKRSRGLKNEGSFFGLALPRRSGRRPKAPSLFSEQFLGDDDFDALGSYDFKSNFTADPESTPVRGGGLVLGDDREECEGSDSPEWANFGEQQRVRRTEFHERSCLRQRMNREASQESIPIRHPRKTVTEGLKFTEELAFAAAKSIEPKVSAHIDDDVWDNPWDDFDGTARTNISTVDPQLNPSVASWKEATVTRAVPSDSEEEEMRKAIERAQKIANEGNDDKSCVLIDVFDPLAIDDDGGEGDDVSSTEDGTSSSSFTKRRRSSTLTSCPDNRSAQKSARFVESSNWGCDLGNFVVVSPGPSVHGSSKLGFDQANIPDEACCDNDDAFESVMLMAKIQNDSSISLDSSTLANACNGEPVEACHGKSRTLVDENEGVCHLADEPIHPGTQLSDIASPRHRVPQRISSASTIDWQALLMTALEDSGVAVATEDEGRRRIRSTEKTKKDEEIARASIVCSRRGGAGDPRRGNHRSVVIKGRGRQAVEAWRRQKRAFRRHKKEAEEMQYAFALEFDPCAMKPVEFSQNVFRRSGTTNNSLDMAPLDLFAEGDMADAMTYEGGKTQQELYGELVGQSKDWQEEMQKLFSTTPELHRKNRVSRASF